MDLTGKVAIITGSTRGIGNAIANRLAEAGAMTVVNGVSDAARVENAAEAIRSTGKDCIGVLADVGTADGVNNLMDTAVQKYGKIDILVNNAGIIRDHGIIRMTEEDWDNVIRVNLKSVFLCSKAALKYMLKQRSGRIISISNIVGIYGNAGQSNYSASKAGIIGFTRTLAKEVGSRGITVNAIAPGFIDTDMTRQLEEKWIEYLKSRTALGFLGIPEDIAEAVAFLASDKAGYITGHILGINGGMGGI
ncbi:MAG: 3-oxoacyl-[acyl-carrier-protein] reductase [Chloroflexi bacterium RBG_13_46_14]|nr:MAG: 3-oxoacyl-[acyl-carrier-protein] reductase [Chloroflexi bacterium RBG_13_46_14]